MNTLELVLLGMTGFFLLWFAAFVCMAVSLARTGKFRSVEVGFGPLYAALICFIAFAFVR